MSIELYTEPILAIVRSAKGPESADYERIWLDFAAGRIVLDELCEQVNRVRARVLVREGPHLRPFPRNQQTLDYCDIRSNAAQGVHIDAGARHAGEKGRFQFERWYYGVADAFDIRVELARDLRKVGTHQDHELADALIAQGDQMQAHYRAQPPPWWPMHIGDKYPSVLDAWAHLRGTAPERGAGRDDWQLSAAGERES